MLHLAVLQMLDSPIWIAPHCTNKRGMQGAKSLRLGVGTVDSHWNLWLPNDTEGDTVCVQYPRSSNVCF